MESKSDTSGESDVSKAQNTKSSSVQENEEGSVHDIPKSSLYTSTRAASSVSKIQVMYQVTGSAFLCIMLDIKSLFIT